MKDQSQAKPDIFGSFFLETSEFALPVRRTQEVVHLPAKLTALPLSPPHLLGVFNLRGAVIPVIDLKALLGIEATPESSAQRKVAIVEHGGLRIGLLFDRTGEIFRHRIEDEGRLDYDRERSAGAVISGIIKLDGGKRLVQILDVPALLDLERIPRCADPLTSGDGDRSRTHKQSTRRQAISFTVGDTPCAFGIDTIHEIIRVPEIKKSVFASDFCPGMFELRGEIVPVVDFARLLGREGTGNGTLRPEDRRIILLKTGRERIGLLVQSVESIITYFAEDLLAMPALSSENASTFAGCISLAGVGDFILLHAEPVLAHPDVRAVIQGHQKIYQANGSDTAAERQKKGQRRSYITFKVERLFALGISEVKEIIGMPDDVLRPPGLPPSIQGMLNLRGRMVTVLDARTLYRLNGRAAGERSQVLIFERNGMDYGLVVDSVESIISFCEEDQLKLPEMLFRGQESGGIGEDVKFAVEVEVNQEKKTLFVLNLDPLTKRVAVGA